MTSLPRLAFARLPAAPPPGSMQFFDGLFPALTADTYTIGLTHTVTAPSGEKPSYNTGQLFTVTAPEFTIDPALVQQVYPPAGASGTYAEELPFVVLGDPSLPWERSLVPGTDQPDASAPVPWMALVLFAEGEIVLPPGSASPVTTTTVQALLAPDPDVLKPDLPEGWVSAQLLASQCQTITVPGAVFAAVMPQGPDLPYLAHCRGVSGDEGEVLLSVLLANRLAVPAPQGGAPLRWYAHVVSLEGFGVYLGPGATPIPQNAAGTGPRQVQMASLYGWTFVSMPQEGLSFAQLAQGLAAGDPALRLPVPAGTVAAEPAAGRLAEGYAPLAFAAGRGEQSFAWFRGPFTPVVPQPLPPVGNPAVPVAQAASADALMIYLAEQGVFDLSYAAAFNLGRQLALADAGFARALQAYRVSSRQGAALLAQRMTQPHLAGVAVAELLAPNASRARFAARMAEGMGGSWTAALAGARAGAAGAPAGTARPVAPRLRAALSTPAALAHPGATAALSDYLAEVIEPVGRWLARLALLYPVPFSHLVPDPRMLPVESVRFFYVDAGWTDALAAGAMSIAVHTAADAATLGAVLPSIRSAAGAHLRAAVGAPPPSRAAAAGGGTAMTGMLIRSRLVSGWPTLVVTASAGGAPVALARDDTPAPAVRLVLFDGVPDMVTIAEPYGGLRFGVEDAGVLPRCVTDPALAGAALAGAAAVPAVMRAAAAGAAGGVMQVRATALALEAAAGVAPFAADAVVQWNGSPLPTTFAGPTRLTATVPQGSLAAAGTASVTVVSGGATSRPAVFTIDPPLSIDSLSPAIAPPGTQGLTLTVLGNGFAAGATVQWNGEALPTTPVSVNQVTAAVSAAELATAGTAQVTVAAGGSASAAAVFTVAAAQPAIDWVSPRVAAAGGAPFTLAVRGSGFASGAVVQWNGAALATTFVDATELWAAVATAQVADAGPVAVAVLSGGVASAPAAFAVAGAGPAIGALAPPVALAGAAQLELVIDGANFAAGAVAQWNGTALATTFDDPGQVTAIVPATLLAAPGTVAVTVSSGGAASDPIPFTVLAPQPAVGLLEPAGAIAGSGDLVLTVTGGFGAGDYALQMVKAPERQSFLPPAS